MIWWILPAAVGVFGLVVVLTGFARIGRMKVISGSYRSLIGALFMGGAGLLSMVGLNLQTYSRLTHERDVAFITIEATDQPQYYLAHVTLEGEEFPVDFDVLGDELRLEARVVKWTPWANILGYDSIYKLDRLSGRYSNIRDEREKERSIHSVTSEPGVDVFELIKQRGGWLKAVDAYYGSGTYVPMVDGAQYEVLMTQNGLITRPVNAIATDRLKVWQHPAPDSMAAPGKSSAPE